MTQTDLAPTQEPTPEELVKRKFPLARVFYDDQRVYISVVKLVTGKCPHCHREDWLYESIDHSKKPLGGGRNEDKAWENAAHNLKLLSFPAVPPDIYPP